MRKGGSEGVGRGVRVVCLLVINKKAFNNHQWLKISTYPFQTFSTGTSYKSQRTRQTVPVARKADIR